MFSEENKIPEHCLNVERWQGPPHINKVKQHEIVYLFSLFSHVNKSVNEDLSLLIKSLSQNYRMLL